MRLLIIDDDVTLAKSLYSSLKKTYAVDLAHTADQGEYEAVTNDYDALILDFNLPEKTGVELCRMLRSDGCRAPILMLTGRGDVEDKVLALDSGVDDYLMKPFSSKELQARLRALLRRQPLSSVGNALIYKDISLDLNSGEVKKKNQVIVLRRKELQILEFLLRHPGQVIKRTTLLEHVWADNAEPETNSIDVHIKHLRQKLNPSISEESVIIKSVYGLGYQLK